MVLPVVVQDIGRIGPRIGGCKRSRSSRLADVLADVDIKRRKAVGRIGSFQPYKSPRHERPDSLGETLHYGQILAPAIDPKDE